MYYLAYIILIVAIIIGIKELLKQHKEKTK